MKTLCKVYSFAHSEVRCQNEYFKIWNNSLLNVVLSSSLPLLCLAMCIYLDGYQKLLLDGKNQVNSIQASASSIYRQNTCYDFQITFLQQGSNHARQKRRCVNDPCLFQLYLLWISNCIYAACLSIEMEVKRSNQSKAPSINNKHCFLFPLSFFVTAAVFTRVPFFDRNAKGP